MPGRQKGSTIGKDDAHPYWSPDGNTVENAFWLRRADCNSAEHYWNADVECPFEQVWNNRYANRLSLVETSFRSAHRERPVTASVALPKATGREHLPCHSKPAC
jgi:hypothetical protein